MPRTLRQLQISPLSKWHIYGKFPFKMFIHITIAALLMATVESANLIACFSFMCVRMRERERELQGIVHPAFCPACGGAHLITVLFSEKQMGAMCLCVQIS